MKRWLGLLVSLGLLVGLLPIPVHGQVAAYNTVSHLAYCTGREYCLHELAHALDQRAGWVSASPEFAQAVELYLYTEFRKPVLNELPASLLEFTYLVDSDQPATLREVYAFVFQKAEGEESRMPSALQPFYDWTQAERWRDEVQDGQRFYWFV